MQPTEIFLGPNSRGIHDQIPPPLNPLLQAPLLGVYSRLLICWWEGGGLSWCTLSRVNLGCHPSFFSSWLWDSLGGVLASTNVPFKSPPGSLCSQLHGPI